MNRYTYCANNPLRYVDPDGRDYWDPEWGQGRSEDTFSETWFLILLMLMEFHIDTKMWEGYYDWTQEHPYLSDLLALGITTGIGYILYLLAVTNPVGLLIVALVGIIYIGLKWASEQCAELWEDPEFAELLENAKKSAALAATNPNDSDIEVQAIIDLLMLAIFLLQKQFGDEWEDHAPDEVLALYNELENSD